MIFVPSVLFLSIAAGAPESPAPKTSRPNVIVIITDDQGYGDLGFHGNPAIRTPCLDRLARESVRFSSFYVSPVCAPTRASLLTGRWNYRTGVVDTFAGRALMHPDEVTLAEMLSAVGYRTGIFGKWHLGDCYPLRPIDQGFQESLVHRGGGIGQPSDPPEATSYFDPVLFRDGKPERKAGYVTDIITDEAVRFVEGSRGRPFFLYLAYNCPHTPLEVPEAYLERYCGQDLGPDRFPRTGHPLPKREGKQAEKAREETARVYAMISSIDDNLARLLSRLDGLGLARDTLVVFLTDNGPQEPRYNAGMRDRKGSVYEGGIRVPCFVRWPGVLEAGREVDRIAAHIDILPTVLEACGVPAPAGVRLDGRSLLPLLVGKAADWPDRALFFQWHRGEVPEIHRAFAARTQHYKLVQPLGVQPGPFKEKPAFQLFDMAADPLETRDISGEKPEAAAELKRAYEAWFREVAAERNFAPPRIVLGSSREDPVTLTRQDWRGRDLWGPRDRGHWEVEVEGEGPYAVRVRFSQAKQPARAHLRFGDLEHSRILDAGAKAADFSGMKLPKGPGRLELWIEDADGTCGIHQAEVSKEPSGR